MTDLATARHRRAQHVIDLLAGLIEARDHANHVGLHVHADTLDALHDLLAPDFDSADTAALAAAFARGYGHTHGDI
mgnify:CR=1 FL=1